METVFLTYAQQCKTFQQNILSIYIIQYTPTSFTSLSHPCYSLHPGHMPITFLSHPCYTLATCLSRAYRILVTQWPHACPVLIASLLHPGHMPVTSLSHPCTTLYFSLLQSYYTSSTPSLYSCHTLATPLLHPLYILVTNLLRLFHILVIFLSHTCYTCHIHTTVYKFRHLFRPWSEVWRILLC